MYVRKYVSWLYVCTVCVGMHVCQYYVCMYKCVSVLYTCVYVRMCFTAICECIYVSTYETLLGMFVFIYVYMNVYIFAFTYECQ